VARNSAGTVKKSVRDDWKRISDSRKTRGQALCKTVGCEIITKLINKYKRCVNTSTHTHTHTQRHTYTGCIICLYNTPVWYIKHNRRPWFTLRTRCGCDAKGHVGVMILVGGGRGDTVLTQYGLHDSIKKPTNNTLGTNTSVFVSPFRSAPSRCRNNDTSHLDTLDPPPPLCWRDDGGKKIIILFKNAVIIPAYIILLLYGYTASACITTVVGI